MKNTVTVLLALFASVAAYAGQEASGGGNGGGGVSCGSTFESADLYEGRIRYRYRPLPGRTNWSRQEWYGYILARLEKVQPEMKKGIEELLNHIEDTVEIHPLSISDSGDASFIFLEEGCSYEQIAVWDNVTDRLHIDEPSLSRFSTPRDEAGLFIHEAVYKYARKIFPRLVKNSERSRQVVAWLMSEPNSGPIPEFYGLDLSGQNVSVPVPANPGKPVTPSKPRVCYKKVKVTDKYPFEDKTTYLWNGQVVRALESDEQVQRCELDDFETCAKKVTSSNSEDVFGGTSIYREIGYVLGVKYEKVKVKCN